MRLPLLDGIRLICALWVTLGHLGITVPQGPMGLPIKALSLVFCGTAAVIVFFVISGLCIHLPYASGKAFDTPSFAVSRLSRIAIPALAAVGLSELLPDGVGHLKPVLWSLYCEALYYAAYPFLRGAMSRLGVTKLVVIGYVGAAALALTSTSKSGPLWTLGVIGSTLYGFPIWLSGCWLAERIKRITQPSELKLWLLRACMVGGSGIALIANFHSPIGYTISMLPYSVLALVWLNAEIGRREPASLYLRLSKTGQATYSMYLVHMLAPPLVAMASIDSRLAVYAVVAGLTGAFYLAIERPAHRLSRWLGAVALPGLAVPANTPKRD